MKVLPVKNEILLNFLLSLQSDKMLLKATNELTVRAVMVGVFA